MLDLDGRYFTQSELTCRQQAAVAGQNIKFGVDEDWNDKSKGTDAACDLANLSRAMETWIFWIVAQLIEATIYDRKASPDLVACCPIGIILDTMVQTNAFEFRVTKFLPDEPVERDSSSAVWAGGVGSNILRSHSPRCQVMTWRLPSRYFPSNLGDR